MMTNLIPRQRRTLLDDPLFSFRNDIFLPIEQHFNAIFDEFFAGKSLDSVKGKSGYPKLEAGIEGDKFVVRVAVPGVDPEDLEVEIDMEKDVLRISGQMSEAYQSPPDSKYVRKELVKREFHREISIPAELGDRPDAVMKDGMLCLKWDTPEWITEQQESPTRRIHVRTEDSVTDDGGGGE